MESMFRQIFYDTCKICFYSCFFVPRFYVKSILGLFVVVLFF